MIRRNRTPADRVKLLDQMTRNWRMELTMDRLLETITANAGELLRFSEAALMLLEPDGLKLRSQWPLAEALPDKPASSIEQICNDVVRQGKPFYANNMRMREGRADRQGLIYCVPLVANRGILGALYLQSDASDHDFSIEDQEFIEVVGRLAAESIEHALIYQSAITDPLTGLYCHRHFQNEVEQALRFALRSGKPFSIFIMDLDKFKPLNDTYGHEVGNQCLIQVADILRKTLRTSDTIARFGGDEFEVLLPNVASEKAAAALNKVVEAVRQAAFPGPGKLTCTIGAATFWMNAASAQELFLRADEALYEAKEAGRNCFRQSKAVADDIALQEANRGSRPDSITAVQRGLTPEEQQGDMQPVEIKADRLANQGQKIDGHLVIRRLGMGSKGEVVLANQPELDRAVALKRPLTAHITPEEEASFEKEAKVTANLEHPGVITIYSMGRDADGRLYYTMKKLGGISLKEILDGRRGRVTEIVNAYSMHHVVDLMRDVADTVAYAHNKGVHHLDLKPDNILVGDFGEVTVIDWSMGSISNSPSPAGEERSGQSVFGSPLYHPPESINAEDAVRPEPVDVYALGAILYEVLTGLPPFKQDSIDKTLSAIRKGELVSPLELKPDAGIPPVLSELCMQCLSHAPEARPSAAECAEILAGYLRREQDWEITRFDETHRLSEDEWSVVGDGAYRIEDGYFVSDSDGDLVLVWNTAAAGAYRFVAEGWVEEHGELSLIGHGPAPGRDEAYQQAHAYDGYCLQFGADGQSITKLARDGQDVWCRQGLFIEPGRKYTLEMSYEDGWLHGFIDRELVFTYRELYPLNGRHLGFYMYGRGAHIRPVEIRRQTWGLTMPVLRTADDLFQNKLYEAALERYTAVSENNPNRIEALEAQLKRGLTLVKLERAEEGRKELRSLAGTLFEPFGLMEDALLDFYPSTPGFDPQRGLNELRHTLSKHPQSQARARLLEFAQTDTAIFMNLPDESDFEETLSVQRDLFTLAANAYDPPASSHLKSLLYALRAATHLGDWHGAQALFSNFSSKFQPEQIKTGITRDMLASFEMSIHNKVPELDLEEIITWSLSHLRPLNWNAPYMISVCSSNLPAFQAALEKKSTDPLALLACYLHENDFDGASRLLTTTSKQAGRNTAHLSLGNERLFGIAWLLLPFDHLFSDWLELYDACDDVGSIDLKGMTAIKTLKAISDRNLERAAQISAALEPAHKNSYSVNPLILQLKAFIAGSGLADKNSKDELIKDIMEKAAGPDRELCMMMLGRMEPKPTDKWPAPLWYPELYLMLAWWLERQGRNKEALEIAGLIRDERFTNTILQPLVSALCKRLG